jgi:hypothetical protein
VATADQPTCGQGLAEHSRLPTKLGELTAAVAENLEAHLRTLDLTDENAKREYGAYVKLAAEHRELAARLRATGAEMAGYHDLPMGRHDPEAMSSPRVVEAFERFAKVEEELLALLRDRVEQNRTMLATIDEAAGS